MLYFVVLGVCVFVHASVTFIMKTDLNRYLAAEGKRQTSKSAVITVVSWPIVIDGTYLDIIYHQWL